MTTNKLSNLVHSKSNEKTVEEKYQKLDEISHVLKRPGRYLGSITPHTTNTYLFYNDRFIKKEITYTPALLKVFDEVISNSVDFSKTEEGKHLNTIKVIIDKDNGDLSVYDNGGITVVEHKEHKQWIPELIFELRAGSNFNDEDDSTATGQNGEGAALTSIFSTKFNVETADGKKYFKQTHYENSRRKTTPKILNSTKNYTNISWSPDYQRFGLDNLNDDNYQRLIKRVYDVAGCNSNLKIYLNGSLLKITSFKEYIGLYVDDYVYDENDNWKIGIASAKDGFEHLSFVNGTETFVGGTHIDYVSNQIVSKLREYFKKKHKIDVKPTDIKNHLHLFINATIINPRYSSQTKEQLITEPKLYQTTWECDDKFIKKVIQLEAIQNILDWVKAKEQAQLNADLRKTQKSISKNNPKAVDKFSDANETKDRYKCELYLAEGDSGRKAIQNARGKNPYIGSYAFRGKLLNVSDVDDKIVLDTIEIQNLLTITGLELGKPVKNINQLRFGKIISMTDEDNDGMHITSLIYNFFAKYFPEIYELGVIYRLKTPLYIVYLNKKETLEFFTDSEYKTWAAKGIKHTFDYFKGLGTFEDYQFKNIIDNREKYLTKISKLEIEDFDKLKLAFSDKKADDRKIWLKDALYFNTYD